MMTDIKVGQGEREYFNGAIKTVTTGSSVLVSSSKYLNNAELRNLISQEMLRRNGPDMPNTAFIPEVAQILMTMEDFGRVMALFEEEKARLPKFKEWCDKRALCDFKKDEVKDCKPGTLGASLYDFMVNSGYELDIFYREIQVVNDLTFYLRQAALTHDIDHMITGFLPNHGGEVALLTANMHSKTRYFHPELANFFNRVATYLKAKTIMKDGLHYPEDRGAEQGRNWKYPIMLADWRAMVDWQIADIREELSITPVPEDGLWDGTNRLCNEDDPDYGEPMMEAAE